MRTSKLPPRLFLVAVAALLFAAADAAAEPEFPGAIHDGLALDYAPPCYICHDPADPKPNAGTMNQEFGIAMRSAGVLVAKENNELPAFFARLKSESRDTDGDGVSDYDELTGRTKTGHPTNPSTKSLDRIDILQPAYGCGATAIGDSTAEESSISGRSSAPAAAATAIAFGLALAARLRRR